MVLSVGRYAGLIVVSFGKIDCAAAIWWDRIPVDWINHSLSILAIILWFGTADSQSTFTIYLYTYIYINCPPFGSFMIAHPCSPILKAPVVRMDLTNGSGRAQIQVVVVTSH